MFKLLIFLIFFFSFSAFANNSVIVDTHSGWIINDTMEIGEVNKILLKKHFCINAADSGINTTSDTFEYFLNNPETAAFLLNKFRIAKCSIMRTDTGYWADDCAGVTVDFKEVFYNKNKKIFFGYGNFKNIFKAKGIVEINYFFNENKHTLDYNVKTYIRLNSGFLYMISYIFKPVIIYQCQSKLDYYISRVKKFFEFQ